MPRRYLLPVILLVVILLATPKVFADTTTSYVGTLATSESTFEGTLTLTSVENVTLQTYGFGGGTNGNGMAISPGGTDDFVGLFSGTGSSASFIAGSTQQASVGGENFRTYASAGPINLSAVTGADELNTGDFCRMTLSGHLVTP